MIVEVNGDRAWRRASRTWVARRAGIADRERDWQGRERDRRTFTVSLSPTQWEILGRRAFAASGRSTLPAGRHQVRVASIDGATGRGGSVYLDVNVAQGTQVPTGMLVASRILSVMPTVFTDDRLARWTTVTPTATRVFPEGDVLTITVPHAGGPATARLLSPIGGVIWEGAGLPLESASAVQFTVPVAGACSPACDLTVQSSSGLVRTALGVVPARIDPAKDTTSGGPWRQY